MEEDRLRKSGDLKSFSQLVNSRATFTGGVTKSIDLTGLKIGTTYFDREKLNGEL